MPDRWDGYRLYRYPVRWVWSIETVHVVWRKSTQPSRMWPQWGFGWFWFLRWCTLRNRSVPVKYCWAKPGIQDGVQIGPHKWNGLLTWWGVLSIKKKSKNPRKTRIGQSIDTHPPINFFWNMFNKKNHKKHKIKKKKSELVLESPIHPLPSFSQIFGFFLTWQNPLISGTNCYIIPLFWCFRV